MISASTSHVGLVRKENQDALRYLTTKYSDLFVVCDGVGGLPNGALASQTAADSIIKGFSTSTGDTTELQLLDAMENGQKSVMKANPKPLGTTVATCCLYKGLAHAAWCGDSRIYHFRDSSILWMSRDHNVLHDILNRGSGHGGMFMNPKALNRFFGREFEVKSDYYSFQVEDDDQILLCSDGLSNFLSERDIIHAVTNNSPQEASDIMERKLLSEEIGAPDNFTWYIIHI
jgi:protein phosphatase